ncbi:MAG: hypothetical protein JNM43_10285 [Planctomycetaceae bacterium]|nr:hypothetical protein [Planctomycetaceae bacterium]
MFKGLRKSWLAISGILLAVALSTLAAVVQAADDKPQLPAVVTGDKCLVTLRKVVCDGEAMIELSRDGNVQTAYRFVVMTNEGRVDATPHARDQIRVLNGQFEMFTSGVTLRCNLGELRVTASML